MSLQFNIEKKLVTHSERVKCVDLHPTEPWVLMSLFSGRVYIYNYETAQIIKSLEIVQSPIRTCKFIERKAWFVIGCDDSHIRVYNYNTMEKVTDFEAHTDYIRSVDVHPTLPYLLSCGDDMKIKLWNWDQNWNLTYEGHNHYIMCVRFNPKDSNSFASCSLDSIINFWGLNSTTPFYSLRDHKLAVNTIAFHPQGDKPYLISGSDDKTVKVWDYQAKTCIQTLEGHTDNISSLCFHPKLPFIITASEDGTVRLWSSVTYQQQMVLNYGMGRVWSVCPTNYNNKLGLAFDDGSMVIQIGSEKPVISFEDSGRVLMIKGSDIRGALIKVDSNVKDGDALEVSYKDLGHSEIFVQRVAHNPNGRFLMLVGGGEYSICTSRQLRSKCYGNCVDSVWRDTGTGDYAVLVSNSTITLNSNFKQTLTLTCPFNVERIYGGHLLGVKGNGFICFYDWESGEMIRKVDVFCDEIYWSKTGSYVCLTYEDGYYILAYNKDASNVDDSFVLVNEITDHINNGIWYEDIFIYSTNKCLKYYIGNEVIIVSHLNAVYDVLGYLEKENKVLLVDLDANIVSYTVSTALLKYQTYVFHKDIENANLLLPSIPESEVYKLSQFLESQGYKKEAMEVSKDIFKKIDLALELELTEKAIEYLNSVTIDNVLHQREIYSYWNRISELFLRKGDIENAKIYSTKGNDFSFLLLLSLSSGDKKGLEDVYNICKENQNYNLAFIALLYLGDPIRCIQFLQELGRYSEAAIFACHYAPEKVKECQDKWHEDFYAHERKIRQI